MTKPPAEAAEAWNKHVPAGSLVDYRSHPNAAPQRFKTRTEASVLGGHTAVVWLVGKSGCVAIEACTPAAEPRRVALADWRAEGERLFGSDDLAWRFRCPSCGHVAAATDWRDAGASEAAVAFSCVGRYLGDAQRAAEAAFRNAGGPCDYTSGGLFVVNKLFVVLDGGKEVPVFEFAEEGVGT